MIGIVKSIYDEVVKASELLRDKGQINFKNDYEDCFTLSYNRYVGVTYSNPWEMPALPHPVQNCKRNAALLSRAQDISKRREVWIKMPDPPEDFEFNIHYAMPFAVQALKTDRELRLARQIFVPSRMSVYNFWRKYFWYIELMKCQVIDQFQLGDAVQPEPEAEEEEETETKETPRGQREEKGYIRSRNPNPNPNPRPSASPNQAEGDIAIGREAVQHHRHQSQSAAETVAQASFKTTPKFYEQARVAVIREHMRRKLNAANAVSLDRGSGVHPARRPRKVSFNDSLNYIPDSSAETEVSG